MAQHLILLTQASQRAWRLGKQEEVRMFYLAYAVRFWADVSDATARGLMRASFLYLPSILLLLLLNPLPV